MFDNDNDNNNDNNNDNDSDNFTLINKEMQSLFRKWYRFSWNPIRITLEMATLMMAMIMATPGGKAPKAEQAGIWLSTRSTRMWVFRNDWMRPTRSKVRIDFTTFSSNLRHYRHFTTSKHLKGSSGPLLVTVLDRMLGCTGPVWVRKRIGKERKNGKGGKKVGKGSWIR